MKVQSWCVVCIGALAGRGGTCPKTSMSGTVTWVSDNASFNTNTLMEIRQLKQIFLK